MDMAVQLPIKIKIGIAIIFSKKDLLILQAKKRRVQWTYKMPGEALGATSAGQNSKGFEKGSRENDMRYFIRLTGVTVPGKMLPITR